MRPFLRFWLFGVRVIDRLPVLRQLHWQPPLRRWYFPARAAALVRPSLRFALFELMRRETVRPYTLRESGLTAHVRHPLNDMWVIDEIYVQRVYEPPEPVLAHIEALGRSPRFLDLGGHAGLFALFVLGRFEGSTVTSFEPNPENAGLHDASLRANATDGRWQLVRAAAGPADGTARLEGPSFLSMVGDVGAFEVEVRDVFPLLDEVDVAKIDIEGSEWRLLEDPRLADAKVKAVVLELHDDGSGGTAYRERARELLRDAGFTPGPLFDERPDTACVWAWR